MDLLQIKEFMTSSLTSFLSLEDSPNAEEGVQTKRKGRIYLTCDGMEKTLSKWAFYLGINKSTLYSRLKRGWSVADALYTPVRGRDLQTSLDFLTALTH